VLGKQFWWYSYLATTNGVYRDKLTEFGLGVKDNPIVTENLISPNPASNYINVDLSFLRMQESEIKIFDVFGNCVLSVESQNFVSLQKIDISTLPSGIYFVRIGDVVQKFVKM